MGIRIIIAGESQCPAFAECCLVADYLQTHLPNFCYNRIEKSVIEWKTWLCKLNLKYKWHHQESPIIWKEMLTNGSKPFYIGGASDFLDYCYSYYNFDALLATSKNDISLKYIIQNKKKLTNATPEHNDIGINERSTEIKNIVITISGAGHVLAMYLISQLLDLSSETANISKIYLYESNCSEKFMQFVETQCSYVATFYHGKILKHVEKIGTALTSTDALIILDHVPFNENMAVGGWLHENRQMMKKISLVINASASRKMRIILPNVGPACYNATVLRELVNKHSRNIVVATSDLGLEIVPLLAEFAEVSMRNIFCPPVWGYVGINHLVDIKTTVHRYNTFVPYDRYMKVDNSTLKIGKLIPEMRLMDYLTIFDESRLWMTVTEMRKMYHSGHPILNKSISVIHLIKLWMFNPAPDHILSLGISCNGAFGLKFDGIFSQPARLIDGHWVPATNFLMPRQVEMKLSYLEKLAYFVMNLRNFDLPKIVPYVPCCCKRKEYKKKEEW